jgi:hypothetical protein
LIGDGDSDGGAMRERHETALARRVGGG